MNICTGKISKFKEKIIPRLTNKTDLLNAPKANFKKPFELITIKPDTARGEI